MFKNRETPAEFREFIPQKRWDGVVLPVTGDYVVTKFIDSIRLSDEGGMHKVTISTTKGKEFSIPCPSKDVAVFLRDQVMEMGRLLDGSGGY